MTRDDRQDLAIERWKAAGGRSSWVLPTGFGKTRTALKTISRMEFVCHCNGC